MSALLLPIVLQHALQLNHDSIMQAVGDEFTRNISFEEELLWVPGIALKWE